LSIGLLHHSSACPGADAASRTEQPGRPGGAGRSDAQARAFDPPGAADSGDRPHGRWPGPPLSWRAQAAPVGEDHGQIAWL